MLKTLLQMITKRKVLLYWLELQATILFFSSRFSGFFLHLLCNSFLDLGSELEYCFLISGPLLPEHTLFTHGPHGGDLDIPLQCL